MNGRAEELIRDVLKTKNIKDVFFVACGGSLVDLYPGFYFLECFGLSLFTWWQYKRGY